MQREAQRHATCRNMPQERIARRGTALVSDDGGSTRSRVSAAINRLNAASAPSLHGQVRVVSGCPCNPMIHLAWAILAAAAQLIRQNFC